MTNAERALDALRTQVGLVSPDVDPAAVAPGTSLEQLGCSSIDRAEITVLTMEALRVPLGPRELARVRDIDTLLHALVQRMP